MSRILLAAHAGPSSTGAVRVAPLVAARLGAELDVVGVMAALQPVDYRYGVVYADPAEVAALTREVAAELTAQLARYGLVGVTPVIRSGQPAIEIAAAARETGACLIVVGLGPHHALDRALGHETALQLLPVASAPVLAVPAVASALPHRIVVGIDFAPSSLLAAGRRRASCRRAACCISSTWARWLNPATPRRAAPAPSMRDGTSTSG